LIDAAATHHKVFHPEKEAQEKLKFICRTFFWGRHQTRPRWKFSAFLSIYIQIFFSLFSPRALATRNAWHKFRFRNFPWGQNKTANNRVSWGVKVMRSIAHNWAQGP